MGYNIIGSRVRVNKYAGMCIHELLGFRVKGFGGALGFRGFV